MGASGGSEPTTVETEDLEVRGSRFSKSADERQRMLHQRKEELLQRARRSATSHYWDFSCLFLIKCGELYVFRFNTCFVVFIFTVAYDIYHSVHFKITYHFLSKDAI